MSLDRRSLLRAAVAAGAGAALPSLPRAVPGLGPALGVRAAEAAGGAWRTQRGNDARTAYVAAGPSLPRLRRLVPAPLAPGATIPGTEPVVAGGIVCWPTMESGRPRLRRVGGGARWRITLPAVPTSPLWEDGPVVQAGPHVLRYRADGSRLWTVTPPPSEPELSTPNGIASRNGYLAVGIGQDLYVLDLADGSAWSRTVVPNDFDVGRGSAPMIDERGTAWYVFQRYVAVGMPPDGAMPAVDGRAIGNGVTIPLLAPGGRIFVGAHIHGLRVIDRTTGTRREYGGGMGFAQRGLACDGFRLYYAYGSGDPVLDVWDLTTDTLAWSRPGARTAPLVWGSFVIVGENRKGIVAYDAATGAEQWRLPGTARGADPVAAGGVLYAGYSPEALPSDVDPPLCRFAPA